MAKQSKTPDVAGKRVQQAVLAFREAQEEYMDVGALDTEPDSQFGDVVSTALDALDIDYAKDEAGDWDLLDEEDPERAEEAEETLTEAAHAVVDAICAIPLDQRREKLEHLLYSELKIRR